MSIILLAASKKPKKMSDKVVVSLGDALLRQSDLRLLEGPHWLNDAVIGFYFEYLHQHKFDSSSKICFVSPEVSQFLKLARPEEISIFLEPLNLEEKEIILLAVNNAQDPTSPGGSHWSLLIFSRQALEFFHLDSSNNMNEMDAQLLAKKLHDFLMKKIDRFKFEFSPVDVIKQTNGYDCGIHLLSHAEHATRHYLMYGNANGLDPLEGNAVKNKRKEIREIILSFSTSESNEYKGGR